MNGRQCFVKGRCRAWVPWSRGRLIAMLIIRCTRKLPVHTGPPATTYSYSTTRLGDYYAQPVNVGRRRYGLLIGQHSRLPHTPP